MSLFHSILSQIQEKILKETSANEIAASIISTTLGTHIAKEQVSVKGTTIRITTTPTIKMAIMMKQKTLLAALQQEGFSITTIS